MSCETCEDRTCNDCPNKTSNYLKIGDTVTLKNGLIEKYDRNSDDEIYGWIYMLPKNDRYAYVILPGNDLVAYYPVKEYII